MAPRAVAGAAVRLRVGDGLRAGEGAPVLAGRAGGLERARHARATPTAARSPSRRRAPRATALGGSGGGIGPALAGRSLDLAAVEAQIEAGGGAMPADLVDGQRLADVLAYIAANLVAVGSGAMEVSAEIVRLRLAETFVIARGRAGRRGRRACARAARRRRRARRGSADRALRGDRGERAAVRHRARAARRRRPFALEEIEARLREIPGEQAAKAALDAALHDLQGKLLGIPTWKLLGMPRSGPPTSWTVWLGDPDDMARRAETGRGALPAAQAQARRRRRARRRACARGACGHHAAPSGGRQRGVVARGGPRGAAAAGRARGRVLRAAAALPAIRAAAS